MRPSPSTPSSADSARPFDITEYGDAATRVGATLKELNGVVTNLDRSLPQVQSALDNAVQRGNQTIDHAFERGVQLAAIVVGFAAIATLLVRWISARFLVSRAS